MFYIGNAASGRIELERELPTDVKAFHISGPVFTASEQVAEMSIQLVRHFSKEGAVITFDPNWREQLMRGKNVKPYFDEMLENTEVFLPGDGEIMLMTGTATVEEAVESIWNNKRYRKIKVIAVKMGKKGSHIYTRTENFFIPVFEIEEIDPTGAGDSFDAGFTCAYIEGKTLKECACYASLVAAVNTQNVGGMSAKMKQEEFDMLLKQV